MKWYGAAEPSAVPSTFPAWKRRRPRIAWSGAVCVFAYCSSNATGSSGTPKGDYGLDQGSPEVPI